MQNKSPPGEAKESHFNHSFYDSAKISIVTAMLTVKTPVCFAFKLIQIFFKVQISKSIAKRNES